MKADREWVFASVESGLRIFGCCNQMSVENIVSEWEGNNQMVRDSIQKINLMLYSLFSLKKAFTNKSWRKAAEFLKACKENYSKK